MSESITEMPTDNINELNSNEIVNDRNSDSGVHLHDAENNIEEKFNNLIDINGSDVNLFNGSGCNLTDIPCRDVNLSNGSECMNSDFSNEYNDECEIMNIQTKDEEFHDAVQFFKDPSCLTYFENAGTSGAPIQPSSIRTSLYMNFDPLHAKFSSQTMKCNGLQEISEVDVVPEVPDFSELSEPINKHLSNISPVKSRGSTLISFDSPVLNGNTVSELETLPISDPDTLCDALCEPPKHYGEDEYQMALKTRELAVQDIFMKKERELEQNIQKLECKLQENDKTMKDQNKLCLAFINVLRDLSDSSFALSEQKKEMQESYEKEINKLKEDLKTSMEDLQSVESTFADFHKRYEQCKGMLKVYTQNEDNLKQQLENLNIKLQEKDEMYKALQARTEEIVDKANTEVANAKKSGEAQITVLKAQLKKAELKISSLESDVNHIKGENGQLSSVIDELMAKVSEG